MEELKKPIRLIEEESKMVAGKVVGYRIEATEYHKTIKPGTRGGYAISEDNVDDTSWIFDDSVIAGKGFRLVNGTIIQDNSVIGEDNNFIDSSLIISNCNIINSAVFSSGKEYNTDINFIKDTRITKEQVHLNGRCSLVNCVIEREKVPTNDSDIVNLYNSHLVDSVIINPDHYVELSRCFASRLRIIGGSVNFNVISRDYRVILKDVSVIGKNSFILGHNLSNHSLLSNVELKGGCVIEVNEGCMHIENKSFEGDEDSITHKYEESGNLRIMGE